MNATDTLFTIFNFNESEEHSLVVTNEGSDGDSDAYTVLNLFSFVTFGIFNE
jgi:hypothetical protein